MVKVSLRMVRNGAMAVAVLLNACAPGEAKEAGLGPDGTPELTSVTVAPASVTLAAGAATAFVATATLDDGSNITPPVSWSANSGLITTAGAYTAPSVPGTYRVIATVVGSSLADTSTVTVPAAPVTLTALTLVPGTVSLQTGVSQQFSINALWSNGGTTLPPVSYSATGGTVDGNGLFVAGGTPGTFRVIVSHNGGTLADTSSITILAPPAVTLTNLVIIPGSVTLQTDATQQFAVAGTWSDGSTTTPVVSYSATGGSVNGAGVYTAGSSAGSFRVIALHAASGRADTSSITITAPPVATLNSLVLTPASASLNTGATRQFSIAAQWSDGSTSLPAVSYSATGGTISAGGLYTAGSTAGSFRVIVSHAASGLADTSEVTLTVPAPTLSSISMTPATVSLLTGATQQFSTTALWSDGSTTVPTLTYSATGGSISAGGLYTAGSTAGTYRVIVSANGRADTSSVTLTVPAATLTSLVLTPATVSLQTGVGQLFSVSATWSDGSTTVPAVTFSATGGTIIQNGQYTAGSTAGTFRVIVSANGRADTSAVTITAPAATLTSISMTPASVSLNTGATQQFSTTAQWSDGSTTLPSLTYSATGGTVSGSGLYTASSTGGTFRVIVTGGGRADTSAVTLTSPTATIASLAISPKTVTVNTGASQQYSATATMSDGSTQTNPTLTWAATGGTINAGRLYTAGSTTGSFRVIVSSANGRADTSSVTLATAPTGGDNMFFNSAESGCGNDSNVLLCDDFEDGSWYSKDCDQANGSGGLLQTDGWCGTIYNASGLSAGTAKCGGLGIKSNCVATTAAMSGGTTGNMADHAFPGGQGVDEVWVRFYTKPLEGYQFGAEKMLTFNDGQAGGAGIRFGNLSWNCASNAAATGNLTMGFPVPVDVCQTQNQGNNLTITAGNWYFYEVHYKLSAPGQSNGVFELWVNNCGADGNSCGAAPTLRMRRSDINNNRASANEMIRVLWFEAWSNPVSRGERYWDQIKVARVGPIGFMN
jgi:hypothetical protein